MPQLCGTRGMGACIIEPEETTETKALGRGRHAFGRVGARPTGKPRSGQETRTIFANSNHRRPRSNQIQLRRIM
eukprot:6840832-Pyramimonas_sp.AAC.1